MCIFSPRSVRTKTANPPRTGAKLQRYTSHKTSTCVVPAKKYTPAKIHTGARQHIVVPADGGWRASGARLRASDGRPPWWPTPPV